MPRRPGTSLPTARWTLGICLGLGLGLALPAQAGPAVAPQPQPSARVEVSALVAAGHAHLRREDPRAALASFREALALVPDAVESMLGMAETYLFVGRADVAQRYVEGVRRRDPEREDALALHVRVLIRAAEFDAALAMSGRALERVAKPSAELLAAHASALFRVQRTVDAAAVYHRVIALDPDHAEAHLRLGSGLTPPCRAPIMPEIMRGIRAQQRGRLSQALTEFRLALRERPGHPIAHRLLGETLYTQAFARSMVGNSEAFLTLQERTPVPAVAHLPLKRFFPAWEELSPSRKKVAARALALFARYLPKLVVMGGRHDLLAAHERTTDSYARSSLRGKRTFDGRVWDDVRGIGGLRAATGIESLDEAWQFGFDTLSHEIAHQAHLYAFKPLFRSQVSHLYKQARKEGRFLDFYAATNEAEYFGQGVEAFVSLAKRPGCEKTHGHTRFELYRRDPALYHFIHAQVEFDPLARAEDRAVLLPAAVDAALQSGRPEDAVVAAKMMDPGATRRAFLRRARRALKLAQSY